MLVKLDLNHYKESLGSYGENFLENLSLKNHAHIALYAWAGELFSEGIILDAGSEMGFGMKLLNRAGRKVLGIDIAFNNLLYSQTHNNNQSTVIHLCSDLLKIPLMSNSCDGICLINILHLTRTPHVLIKECQRVLRKRKPLIASIPVDCNYPDERHYSSVNSFFDAIMSDEHFCMEYPQLFFESGEKTGNVVQHQMASFFSVALCYNF